MQQELETHKASSECKLNIKLIASVKSTEFQGEIVNIMSYANSVNCLTGKICLITLRYNNAVPPTRRYESSEAPL